MHIKQSNKFLNIQSYMSSIVGILIRDVAHEGLSLPVPTLKVPPRLLHQALAGGREEALNILFRHVALAFVVRTAEY